MKKYIVPDLKKIKFEEVIWKPGIIPKDGKLKKRFMSQSTIPYDDGILEKLGFKKGEKILSIASGHADWIKAIKDKGCIVDYSEYSSYFIRYIKKKIKFNKYIQANFADIPKKEDKYDWTFTYEAVGSAKSLPLSLVRSLFNKKGAKIVYNNENPKDYHNLIKTIAKIYGCKYDKKIKLFEVFLHIHDKMEEYEKGSKKCAIFTIYTNSQARRKAVKDVSFLESNYKHPEKNKVSLKRLSQLSGIINEKYTKEFTI